MSNPTSARELVAHVATLREMFARTANDRRMKEADALAAAITVMEAPAREAVAPDGYHYVYYWPFTTERQEVIVKDSDGGPWNGQKPIRSIPYYYTTPPPDPMLQMVVEALREIRDGELFDDGVEADLPRKATRAEVFAIGRQSVFDELVSHGIDLDAAQKALAQGVG